MTKVLDEILLEMANQIDKWGVQNHSILPESKPDPETYFGIPNETLVKHTCEYRTNKACLSYFDILLEEVVEVANAKTPEDIREELIQVAAVVISMIESLDRNGR